MQHRVHGDGDQTGPACIFDDRHWGRDLSRASLWERGSYYVMGLADRLHRVYLARSH